MKRPQSTVFPTHPPKTPLTAMPPNPRKSRRRGKQLAVVLPVVLAGAAAVSVGAAAYSRDGSHDSAANKAAAAEAAPAQVAVQSLAKKTLASDEEVRGRGADHGAADVPGTASFPATVDASSSLSPTAAAAYRQIRVDVGALAIGHDPMGVSRTSLPLHITNIGGQVKSFDITVAAHAADGATITKDTGTAAHLQPGQSAEVRVMDIVNDAMAESLRAATFAVTDVFAY